MNDCKHVEPLLEEVLFGEPTESQRHELEAHVRTCAACAETYRSMKQTMAMVSEHRPPEPPSTFWDGYYDRLMERMEQENRPAPASEPRIPWWDRLAALLLPQPKWAWQLAVAVLLVAVGILIGRVWTPRPEMARVQPPKTEKSEKPQAPAPVVVETPAPDSAVRESLAARKTRHEQGSTAKKQKPEPKPESGLVQASLDERTLNYLDRSKVLLLGLANFDPADGAVLDVSKNREIARGLIREAAVLKTEYDQADQQRLAGLIRDLEVTLLQIANLEAEHDVPAIEMVQTGVDRKALLLKINITEMHMAARAAGTETDATPGTERL